MISTYDLVRRTLRDDRLANDIRHYKAYPDYVRIRGGPSSASVQYTSRWLALRDGADHARLRDYVDRIFAAQVTPALTTFMAELARHLLSETMSTGTNDFMTGFAHPFAVHVICQVLGVPREDRAAFVRWAVDRGRHVTRTPDDRVFERANGAARAFGDYFDWLLRRRRENPKDDLVSVFAAASGPARSATDAPAPEDLHAACLQLLSAGHLPVAGLLGNSMHPLVRLAQSGCLTGHPASLPIVLEEVIRLAAPVRLVPKVTTDAIELDATAIPRGEVVMLSLASANRDASAFPGPGSIATTPRTHAHLGFGFGPHFCVGARLVRRQLGVVVRELVSRMDLGSLGVRVDGQLDSMTLRVPLRLMLDLPRSIRGPV